MKRVSAIALLTLVLPACANLGLDDLAPLEEAEQMAPPELVAAVHAIPPSADAEIVVDGRLWVPWGLPVEHDPTGLRPVGSTHGTTVYAYAWDRSPFDALFVRHEGEWQGHAAVIGRSGGVPPRGPLVRALLGGAILATLVAPFPLDGQEPVLEKLTPILYVEAIEPVLPFWTDRLGFRVTGEVMEDDRLGFIMMERDGVEVMIQTRESVENDVPSIADTPMGGTILFIQVEDLDAIEAALGGVEILVPRRTTPYGAEEIFVREPGGNVVGFAEFGGSG